MTDPVFRGGVPAQRTVRLALGAVLAAYVPFFAFLVVVTTPAYVTFPLFSAVIAPAVVASLALALLLSARAIRATAWIAVLVLGAWLAENVATTVFYVAQWEMRRGAALAAAFLAAFEHSSSRAPYWLAVIVPMLLAAACLHFFRSGARKPPDDR